MSFSSLKVFFYQFDSVGEVCKNCVERFSVSIIEKNSDSSPRPNATSQHSNYLRFDLKSGRGILKKTKK